MKDEVAAAVIFVTRLVKRNKKLSKDQCDRFSDKLTNILVDRFKNHWHTDKPLKGQAYRCIRINEFEPTDQVLQQAAYESGLNFLDLNLPSELTLWMDPSEVCCRFGENKGSCITVASFKKEKTDNHALTLNVDEMIEEYNKKRSDDIAKLREFTGKRSPVNTPPPQMTTNGHIYSSYKSGGGGGIYHNIPHQTQTKWRNPHYNGMNRGGGGGGGRPGYYGCVFYPHQNVNANLVQYDSGDEQVVMEQNMNVVATTASLMNAPPPTTSSESVISSFPPAPRHHASHPHHHHNPAASKDRYRWVKQQAEPVKA